MIRRSATARMAIKSNGRCLSQQQCVENLAAVVKMVHNEDFYDKRFAIPLGVCSPFSDAPPPAGAPLCDAERHEAHGPLLDAAVPRDETDGVQPLINAKQVAPARE